MKNKKLFITIFSLFIVCVGVFCYFTFHQEEGFRIIKLIDFAGKVEIKRKDVGVLDPYNDLRLIADDKVQTYSKSKAYFSLDSDKYIYCHENSLVQIDSVGSQKNSRTKITLLKGNELNEIQNPLSSKAKYNVETPNSIMSVRGTVFKVSVKYDENGESYATLNVYEGSVKTELVFPDGTISDPIVVKKGYAVDTHGTDKLSEYIISKNATENNDFVYPIDYSSLSKQELESLLEIYNHEKKELSIAKEEVQELLKEKNDTKEETKYTVNFYNQDELLETQVTSEINYPNPNKKGYTFDGWYEDSNLTIKHESSTVTSDLNLYGKWTPKNYKISFDSQGGNTLDAKEVTYDQTYGDLPTPTRQGYTFTGWYLNNTHITSQSKVQIMQDTTLKASWKANEHTVYQVNHYQENLDNDGYTLVDNQQLNGTTNSQVTPNTHLYDGFKSPSKKEVIIKGDGTTVVNYYYQRNLYALTIDGDSGIVSSNGQGNYRYGQNASFNVEVKEGYTFDHFEINNEPITNNLTITKDTKVKAITKINTYTISYELNGGTANHLKDTYTVQDEYQLPIPKKKGYTFIGWNDGTQTNPSKDIKLSKGTTGNKTYTAYYKASTYQISFNTDGGNEIKDKTVTYESTYGKLETPTKQGYTFVGWYLKDTPITEETQVDITSDTTLKAKWQANTYKITFEIANCGGYLEPAGQDLTLEVTYDKPYSDYQLVTMARPGYTFAGWYTSKTGGSKIGEGQIKLTQDISVYPQWTPNEHTKYTVYHWRELLPGEEVTNNDKVEKGYRLVAQESFTGTTDTKVIPKVKSYEGYTSPDQQELTIEGSGDSSCHYYYPRNTCKINFKIKHSDGSILADNQHDIYNSAIISSYTNTKTAKYGDKVELSIALKEGYSVNNWTYEGTLDGQIVGSSNNKKYSFSVPTHNVTIEATVEPVQFNISYNLNDGLLSGQKTKYTVEDDTYSLPTPIKTGYEFVGWTTGENQTIAEITKGTTGEISLTANWTPIKYTIAFNKNADDATGKMDNQENVEYNTVTNLLSNQYSRPGYTFAGWSTSSNGKKDYDDCEKVENLTSNSNAIVTLYALWQANTYTVNFDKGLLTASYENMPSSKQITYHSAYDDLPTLNNTNNCEFAGWYYEDSNGNKTDITKDTIYSYTSDVTLHAKWKKTYTVEYTLENLSGNDSQYTYADIVGFLGEPVLSAQELANKIASENNHSTMFEGYVIPTDDPQKLSEEKTKVTYKFSLKRFNVMFKTNGHISSAKCLVETAKNENEKEKPVFANNKTETTLKFRYGEKIKLSGEFERGYESANFSVIATQNIFENGELTYFELSSGAITKNTTYEVNTKEKTYTISCKCEIGEGYFGLDRNNNEITSQGYDYTISHEDIILPVPKRDGYRFKGYKLEGSNSDELYTVVSKGSTGNLNFVAQWKKDSSTYNVYLECKRDYHEDHFSGNTILITQLTTYQSNGSAFNITLTSDHQHGNHKIEKWRRYYSDTHYDEYGKNAIVMIDPKNEKGDIYFVAVYDDELSSN